MGWEMVAARINTGGIPPGHVEIRIKDEKIRFAFAEDVAQRAKLARKERIALYRGKDDHAGRLRLVKAEAGRVLQQQMKNGAASGSLYCSFPRWEGAPDKGVWAMRCAGPIGDDCALELAQPWREQARSIREVG